MMNSAVIDYVILIVMLDVRYQVNATAFDSIIDFLFLERSLCFLFLLSFHTSSLLLLWNVLFQRDFWKFVGWCQSWKTLEGGGAWRLYAQGKNLVGVGFVVSVVRCSLVEAVRNWLSIIDVFGLCLWLVRLVVEHIRCHLRSWLHSTRYIHISTCTFYVQVLCIVQLKISKVLISLKLSSAFLQFWL